MHLSRNQNNPLYQQVADLLRGEIEDRAQPGDKLDIEPELAKRFGVSLTTVKQALRILAGEGYVKRVQGKGTFVREPKPAGAKAVAILTPFTPMNHRVSCSNHDSIAHLLRRLRAHQIPFRIYPGVRAADSTEKMEYPLFWQDLEAGRVSGIIPQGGGSTPEFDQRLLETGLPVVGRGLFIDYPVSGDFAGAIEEAIRAMLQQGRKRLAFVDHSAIPSPLFPDSSLTVETFRKALGQAGLPLRNHWIVADVDIDQSDSGGIAMRRIWNAREEKPDGVLLFSEWFYTGAARFLLEQGVQVPRDLLVTMIKPQETDLFYPIPTTVLEIASQKGAEVVADRMARLLRGEKVPVGAEWIPFQLREEPASWPMFRTGSRMAPDSPATEI